MDKNKHHKNTHNPEESQVNPFRTDANVKEKHQEEVKSDSESLMTSLKASVESLNAEKETLLKEHESLKSQYVRLAADFDNFRKRQAQEKQDIARYGAVDTVKSLLPVLDSFDRAYNSFQTLEDPEKMKESFNVVYRQMQEALAKLDVNKIKTAGELFDPNYHEAVQQEETSEFPDNTIMMELQSGYILEEKVIRPAMVKVASNMGAPAGGNSVESGN